MSVISRVLLGYQSYLIYSGTKAHTGSWRLHRIWAREWFVSATATTSHENLTLYLGNLALARALGDFEFKKNYSLTPDKQIITSNPDVTVHDITEDDEFFVLACDGAFLLKYHPNSLTENPQEFGTA
jgi:serine/threonine protein phosphatase PrpC